MLREPLQLNYSVMIFLADVSSAAADDSDPTRRFPTNSSTEDLQVPSTAARTAVLHMADSSGL